MFVTKSPKILQSVFQSMREFVTHPQFLHLRIFVIGVLVDGAAGLKGIARASHFGKHRTSLGRFVSTADWDEQELLKAQVRRLLKSLKPRKGEFLDLLIDDTRIVKRARKMDDISKLWDHTNQRFANGHTVVVAAIRFRGVTLPWGLHLWQAKQWAGRDYLKVTEIAAGMIDEFDPPQGVKVRVMFDAFYLCPIVAKACESRGFRWYSVASKNRKLTRDRGRSGSLKSLAPGILRHRGQRVRLKRAAGWRWMKIAATNGRLRRIGDVRIVFSKRPHDPWKKVLAVATNDRNRTARDVISIYETRWMIEVLFKELRSELGLSDYRMQSRKGIRKHLHLVCLAHLVLTHHSMKAVGAKARKAKHIPLPKFRERIELLRRDIEVEQIHDFARRFRDPKIRTQIRQFLIAT